MRAREIIPSFLGGFFGFVLLVAINGAGIVPGSGGGISAGDQAKLDLLTINGSNLELDSGYSFKIDSTRKLFASIIQANASGSLDLREDGGTSAITIDTSGNATFAQNIVGTHAKDLLIGATGEGLRFNVSGSDGTLLMLSNGAQSSNYQISHNSIRIGDVRSGAYYDTTGAGPSIFYAGAVFFPIALPGSPATGLAVSDSGDSNKLKHYDGSTWNATY